MPGPISTAYVDIIGRFKMEAKTDVDKAVRALVAKIDSQLDALEAKGTEAAKKLMRQFKNVKIQIGTRDALVALERLDETAEETVQGLKRLRSLKIGGLDSKTALANITKLETRVRDLSKTMKLSEDETTIRFNVSDAREKLKAIEKSVTHFTTAIDDANRAGVDVQVTAGTRSSLEKLDALVAEVLGDIEHIDRQTVNIKVDDMQVDALKRKLEAIEAQANRTLNLKVRTPGSDTAASSIGSQVSNFQKAFGTAFRRILAFGAIRSAIQGVSQLFRSGVQAAGAIQVVEISLNRFFAQTRDLGQTSTQFFNNLRKLALETPFEFEGLADTSRRILAMGVDADETIGIISDLSDAVAAVGGGQAEIDGVVRALSQLRSKGRVDLQDFRQISENLPSLSRQLQIKGVIDELNALHPELDATVADFDSLRRSGLITGKVLTDGVIRAIKEIPGVSGAARAASRSLQGALSNLRDFAQQEFAQAFGGLGGIIADELNDAFGNLTVGGNLTPLAASIRQITEAFGGAGELVLPEVLEAVVKLAPDLSTLVSVLGELAQEIIPTLVNVTNGAFSSITGITTLFRGLVGVLNILPPGLQEAIGGFTTLALVIPGVSQALTAPIAIMANTARGAELMAAGVTRSAALMKASVVGLVIVGVQILTSSLAKSAERTREYGEAVSEAARSLKEFSTSGEAALDFINKFRIAGEGVDIGRLERGLDGLTSPEIENQLGITSEGLAKLVENIARLGDSDSNSLTNGHLEEALVGTGVAMEDLVQGIGDGRHGLIDLTDAGASVTALADQFAQAAERTFDAAVSSQKYVFVTDEVATSIDNAANKSGDYLTALDELEKANQAGARTAIAAAKQRGATQKQIDDAIAANTTYTTAIDGTTTAEVDFVAALQDVNEALQQQDTIFDGLSRKYTGFTGMFNNLVSAAGNADLGSNFIDFAIALDKASLSAEQMNAVANELGNTLGDAFSGEDLQKLVEGFIGLISGFTSELEAVVPGISDLQFEADNFSLDKFINELNRVATARIEVSSNIEELVGTYGTLGSRALDALISSGLNSEQFAIAIDQALEGTPEVVTKKLQAIDDAYNKAIGPEIANIAEMLTARRFSPEEINTILGLDAFANGVTDLEGTADRLDTVYGRLSGRGPLTAKGEEEARSPQEKHPFLFGRPSGGAKGDLGIDLDAAIAEATTSGTAVGNAFTDSVSEGIGATAAGLNKSASTVVEALATTTLEPATTAGKALGTGLNTGISTEVQKLPTLLNVDIKAIDQGVKKTAEKTGKAIGENLTGAIEDAVKSGINDVEASSVSAVSDLGSNMTSALDQAADFGRITSAEMSALNSAISRASGRTLTSVRTLATSMNFALMAFNPASVVQSQLRIAAPRIASTARVVGFIIGAALNSGIVAGLNATRLAVSAAAAASASVAGTAARQTAVIASPSREWEEIGKQLNAGLIKGIEGTTQQVTIAAASSVSSAQKAATGALSSPTGSQTIVDGMSELLNGLVSKINEAFKILAGRLGVSGVFAGDPIKKFAQGVIATSPTLGIFGEAGAEALLPLSDGRAAANILGQLAPYIPSPGREAAQALLSRDIPAQAGSTVHHHSNTFELNGNGNADPETLAAQIAVRLERKMSR